MKERGFTLIELLAVIVILAIIALIAVPIILNIIEDSKNSSNKRSIELYAKAVENAIGRYQVLHPDDSDITLSKIESLIEYSGSEVKCDNILIDKEGAVSLNECKVNNIRIDYTYGHIYQLYVDGTPVYFNVKDGKSCSKNEFDASWSGCERFYAFGDTMASETVNLLLDHNTSEGIPWISVEDYQEGGGINPDEDINAANDIGPLTLLKQLQSDTKDWKGTEIPVNYKSSIKNYIIDYSGYKARLMTAQEVTKIIGGTWEEIDEYGANIESLPTNLVSMFENGSFWLANTYNYNRNCAWFTITPYANSEPNVYFQFDFTDIVTSTSGHGVRPVITVLKSKLS